MGTLENSSQRSQSEALRSEGSQDGHLGKQQSDLNRRDTLKDSSQKSQTKKNATVVWNNVVRRENALAEPCKGEEDPEEKREFYSDTPISEISEISEKRNYSVIPQQQEWGTPYKVARKPKHKKRRKNQKH